MIGALMANGKRIRNKGDNSRTGSSAELLPISAVRLAWWNESTPRIVSHLFVICLVMCVAAVNWAD